MSQILGWFGIGKQEKIHNVKVANDEIARLRSMLANIPPTGISNEAFLDVKEAYSKLKEENEKLIASQQELIADVHLATEANKAELANVKSALEIEKQSLAKSMAEVSEEKKRMEMAVNKKAAELLSAIGCPVERMPSFATEQDLAKTDGYTIKRRQ